MSPGARGTSTLSHKKLTALTAVLLLIFFCAFVSFHKHSTHEKAQSNIKKHAIVISEALWNFNPQGVSKYLSLACESNNYKHLVITGTEGTTFLQVVAKEPAGIEKILISFNLIPEIYLSSNVIHDGKTIGQIRAIWYCDTIYVEIYVLFALIMLYLIFDLYARLLYAKHSLAVKISKRTQKLQESEAQYRQLYEKSQREEKLYQSILHHSGDAIIIYDMDGYVQYLNPTFTQIFGWSLDELKGRRIPFVPESEREDSRKRIMVVIHDGIPCQGFETTRLTKDGQLLNISLSASRYCDQQNQPVGMLVILRDVTARLQAEGLLRDREAKLQTILQSAPTGIGIAVNRVFQEVNQQLCKMLGYTEQELIGQNARMVYPSDEEYERVGREQQKLIRKYGMGTVETYLHHKNGMTINVLISWKPLDENDLSAGIVFNVLDITEIKKLESQLSQSRKMESIGTLAGGIAHDFNNILTAITGYAQMSLINLEDSTRIKHNVEQIQKAADRAANLTRQMLGFSRKQMVIPQIIDINKLIAEMGKMLKRLVREDINLKISLNKQVGTIYADSSQLEQVIMNLVVNAQDAFIDHAGQTEKSIKVSTSQVFLDEEYAAIHEGSSTGLHLLLQVEDNGCGMTKQVSNRIFEPFYTTKDVGKGTGMGLATVYGIVKQNQGSIYVYSEVGRGSTFKIYWPIMAAEKAAKVEKQKALQPKGGSEVILLAEDDAQIRETSCCQLREAGYTILEAENGLKALEAAIKHQGKIDLLFTDIVMPLMGGKELSEKIKKIHPEITFFYASGYMDETVQQEITDLDQDHFINKPYNINDVMIRIRQLLNKKEL